MESTVGNDVVDRDTSETRLTSRGVRSERLIVGYPVRTGHPGPRSSTIKGETRNPPVKILCKVSKGSFRRFSPSVDGKRHRLSYHVETY